ncbi:hypothetical protein PYW08_004939 [Mythimna loreyi]|uniref:Uncharacterized protein n=1 Tax=Mythimna loreyi TaxID=667449 RepID=A0ACC2QE81_9NEOP|nr:hypothetical protein PYW08_004939 [Mythimna loreyi]
MPSGKLIMMNKRKRDDTSADDAADNRDRRAKKQRVTKRARSEPLRKESVPAEKREALRRLFGRIGAVNMDENQHPASDGEEEMQFQGLLTEEDENALVEDVPADMDPEQLGFLVCAQETLRFLKGLGITYQHPVFNHLRLRLLQGISEIGVA